MRAEDTYRKAWERLCGRFITGGKFPTALRAKTRLKEVIAEDRAAVPCGRWVRVLSGINRWHMLCEQYAWQGRPFPPMPKGRELWPRYRWSERR